MASVKFNLDKPNSDLSYILLKFSYKGKRLRYSTGLKINPSHWNEKRQRLRELQAFPKNAEYNGFLERMEKEAFQFFRIGLDNKKTPSIQEFKDHLNAFRGKISKESEDSFFPFVRKLIADRTVSPEFKPATIKDYRITNKHLEGYIKNYKIKGFDFEDIDLDFFERFTRYLYGELKFSSNYVHKIIKTLKTFLNYAKSKGIEVNPQFKSKGFLVKRTESENIYLTIDELMTIYHLDLSDCDGQNRVRDLFLIGAFTGLRYSDFSNLKKENFRMVDGVQMSEVKTIKTGEKVVIPLNPIVKAILKKYNGEPPRSISNQKTNAALKKIAQKAEINQAVIRTINEGGINKPVRKKKYELVTTHTARRSFATNAFKAGIPSISIMKITGHKSESSFLKYIKVSKEENAVLMAANPFFKLSPLKIAN